MSLLVFTALAFAAGLAGEAWGVFPAQSQVWYG